MLASTAAAPLACHHRHRFGGATAHSQRQLLGGANHRSGKNAKNAVTTASRRSSRAASLVTPKAVSIYDAVRGDDERGASSSSSTAPEPAAPAPPSVSSYSAKQAPIAPAVIAPTVISSKAYMLSTAEDLAAGVACDDGDTAEECAEKLAAESDGIFKWTLKYVDKNLDDLEREKPKQAEVAWKVGNFSWRRRRGGGNTRLFYVCFFGHVPAHTSSM
jgi:hypothetical protein